MPRPPPPTGWMDGWMNCPRTRRVNEWMNAWMDGWNVWTGKNTFFILSYSITNHSSGYHLNVPTTFIFLPVLGGYFLFLPINHRYTLFSKYFTIREPLILGFVFGQGGGGGGIGFIKNHWFG
jgi:hypothetical protein